MSKFKVRKTGSDLHTLKEYNTYGNGAYNAFHPEYAPESVGGTMSGVPNKDSKGNCTWYVGGRYQEMHGVRLPYEKRIGNAGDWVVDSQTPSVGAIVVFTDSQYGHVGSVEKIVGNDIILSESAYSERGNDFLFKFGRTVAEVCNVWGMKVKGYINPPSPSESYEDEGNGLDFKVGDLLEVSYMYENHHLLSGKSITSLNHLNRGVVYVVGLFPLDNNPYAVSYEKGGKQVGGVRAVNIHRANQEDILKCLHTVDSKPIEKPIEKPVSNVGKSWTNKYTPLSLYPNSSGGTNYGGSSAIRTYKVLAEEGSRVQIQHHLFDSPYNKVWVNKSDGNIS